MGAGGPQTAMTLEQKKKLLWGKKPDPEEPPLQEAFGANRWDTAEFSKAEDRSKFIKLMVMSREALPRQYSFTYLSSLVTGCRHQKP